MGVCWKIVTRLGLALIALPLTASAEDAPTSRTADFMPRVLALQEAMEAHGEPPSDEGPGRILYKAWKADLKSRSKRLVSKTKSVARESLWEFDEAEGGAVRIKPKQWGPAVRKIASLYTELGAGHKHYGKVRVSPDYAIRLWDKSHPAPRLTGLTSAGGALLRLRRRARYLRSQGLPVPWTLLREIDRYIILESEEIELRRLAYQRWEEERRRAHIEIRARYAEARVLIQAERETLAEEMGALRSLTADLQLVEEERLRVLVAGFPEADPLHASARKSLKIMLQGRKKAARFKDERTSRYGSLLNQKWTVPRGHLLAAVAKAEKRLAAEEEKKAAPAAEAGGPEGSEAAK